MHPNQHALNPDTTRVYATFNSQNKGPFLPFNKIKTPLKIRGSNSSRLMLKYNVYAIHNKSKRGGKLKTRKSQLKAVENWNKKNPLNVTYNQKKRAAKSFILTDLKGDTKGAQAINANRQQYISDLKQLHSDIEQRLKDLKR